MKKLNYIIAAACTLAMLCSCEDYRDDLLLPNTVYIRPDASVLRPVSVYAPVQEIGVIRSGALKDGGKLTVGASATMLVKQNIADGTHYVNLPSYYYTIEGGSMSFGSDDARICFSLGWDADRLAEFISGSKDDTVIPLSIVKSDLPITDERNLLLLKPVIPSYSMTYSSVKLSLRQGGKDSFTGSAAVQIDYPVCDRDVVLTLAADPSLVGGYGGSAAPDGFFTITTPQVTLRAGENSVQFGYSVDPAALYNDDGSWMMAGSKVFTVPVKVTSCSVPALREGQQKVCYFYTSAE